MVKEHGVRKKGRLKGAAGRFGRAALSTMLAGLMFPAAAFADAEGYVAADIALTSSDSNTVSDTVQILSDTNEDTDTAIDYATFQPETQVECSSSILKYYVVDANEHLAMVGNNGAYSNNDGNGIEFPDGGESLNIMIPATVTDDSGAEWTVKAIGANSLKTGKDTTHNISSISIAASLDYIGSYAFSQMSNSEDAKLGINIRFIDGGSVKTVEASALSYIYGTVSYPEGCEIVGSEETYHYLEGQQASWVVYPQSHDGYIWCQVKNVSMCLKSPYSAFVNRSKKAAKGSLARLNGSVTKIYCWDGSKSTTTLTTANPEYESKYYQLRPMGVLSAGGWTVPDRYVPEGENSYHCDRNVTFPVIEGTTYTLNPKMQLTVTSGENSWEPVLGDDYTVSYADAEGNLLDAAPTAKGTYKVKFTGNAEKEAQTVWGESDWITYKIDPDISNAELSYDEDATTFVYNAKGQAPEIEVTFDGSELKRGTDYQVTYFASDGTTNLEKPSAPGSYRALVISLPPATGIVGIVPFTIESVKIDHATATNIAATAGGEPAVAAYGADGSVIDPAAYRVSYKQGDTPIEASALSDAGSYTAVVTGDDIGCSSSAEAAFTVVAGGKTLASAVQTAELTYTGKNLSPTFTVKDGNGDEVDAANYNVSIATKPATGQGEVVSEVVAAGNYTATFTAKGNDYIGETLCDFTVSAAAIETDAVGVTLNRAEYDYIPTVYWADENATYTTGQRIIHRGEAIEPDVTVTYEGKTLTEGEDYELVCENNTGTDEKFNAKDDVTEATFSVELTGDYSGKLASDNWKYTIKKRAHSYTYKGVKFTFAIDSDGSAVITGLDMDMDSDTTDFSAAYDRAAWDGETFTVPATVKDGDKEYAMKRIAGGAFEAPSRPVGGGASSSSGSRDVLNGSKALVIEKGIEEIGQRAFDCDNLTSISLPEGLKSLRPGCLFGGVVKTKEIVIPSTVNAVGDCVFGQNLSNAGVEKVKFSQPSQVKRTNEWMESSSGTTTVTHATQNGTPFDGGAGPKEGSDSYGWAPLAEVIIPACFTGGNGLFGRFGNLVNVYWMADTFEGIVIPPASGNRGSMTLWGWDLEGSKAVDAITALAYDAYYNGFKPFAVLGDGYTYKNALNPETGVCDAEATYPGNVQIGTPVVTNSGDSVAVDFDLQENFVNSKYAWTPQEGEDYTVAYADAEGNAVESIDQPGTYTATLTGNEKTCFGTATATFTVGAAAIADTGVELESNTLTYNGKAQEPAVTVKSATGATLEAGTDYDVEYAGNRTVGTGTVTVAGKGLYAGSTASAEFEVVPATLTVTGVDASKTYGGADPTLSCTVSGLADGDRALSYTVERAAGEAPGTYAVTPTGVFVFDSTGTYATGNYDVNYVNGTFTVDKIAIAAPAAKSLTYTGAVQTGVADGTGYKLTGASGTAAGTYTATATLEEGYAWSDGTVGEKKIEWKIAPKTVVAPTAKTGLVYNGASQTGVTATSTDYTLTGASATAAGSHTATATLKDKANYAWSTGGTTDKPINWSIAQADLSSAAVTLSKVTAVYTGKSQTSAVTAVKVGSRTLAASDYTAVSASGKAAGTYTATVTGKGNYKGTATAKFSITQAANTAKAAKTAVKSTQKVSALKKKAGTVSLPKVTTKFGTATWKVSTKDKKGVLSLKSGKVQVKKGAKAGKYTLKLKANVAATKNYKSAATKVVTVTVTVKK